MKVAVGSTNPVKIEAVKQAFEKVWPDKTWEVVGVGVDSGVSNQPMSDEESIKGARNRAQRALEKEKADFGAGLESGLHEIAGCWYEFGWAILINKEGVTGIGSTTRMIVPDIMLRMVKQGIEMGEAGDKLFKRVNSKQAEGSFGILTNGHMSRMDSYRYALFMAFTKFLHPEFYGD